MILQELLLMESGQKKKIFMKFMIAYSKSIKKWKMNLIKKVIIFIF